MSLILFVNPTHSQSVPMHLIFNKMKFNSEIKKDEWGKICKDMMSKSKKEFILK